MTLSADQINRARQMLQWTDADLARRANLPLDVVQWIERPECDPPPACTRAVSWAT